VIVVGNEWEQMEPRWRRENRTGPGDAAPQYARKGCRKSAATVLVLLAGAAGAIVYGSVELVRSLAS
jgi:hypothetical protein